MAAAQGPVNPPSATRAVMRSVHGDRVRIGVVDEASCRRVFVDGELDLGTAPTLAAVLSESGRSVCVDLGGVEFCDVSGLNVLLDADRLHMLFDLVCADYITASYASRENGRKVLVKAL